MDWLPSSEFKEYESEYWQKESQSPYTVDVAVVLFDLAKEVEHNQKAEKNDYW